MQFKKKLEVVVFKLQYLVFPSFEKVISSKDFQSYLSNHFYILNVI